jgi:hypothetical protein
LIQTPWTKGKWLPRTYRRDFCLKPTITLSMLVLFLGPRICRVPRESLFLFFAKRSELLDVKHYAVQRAVSTKVFRAFATFLSTNEPIVLTKGNTRFVSSLATEFCLRILRESCQAFLLDFGLETLASHNDRVSALEYQSSMNDSCLMKSKLNFSVATFLKSMISRLTIYSPTPFLN